MKCTINTVSGGTVEAFVGMSRFAGMQVVLTIDQETNIKNTEGSASLELRLTEVKELIADLNALIERAEGQNYVVLYEPLKDILSNEEVLKSLLKSDGK